MTLLPPSPLPPSIQKAIFFCQLPFSHYFLRSRRNNNCYCVHFESRNKISFPTFFEKDVCRRRYIMISCVSLKLGRENQAIPKKVL